jgi:hypothetical protein
MIRFRIERRPESTKLGWSEIREGLVDAFFLVFSLGFLFLSVLLLTSDGIIIRGSSKPFEVATAVVAVGLVALGVERLVRHWREK